MDHLPPFPLDGGPWLLWDGIRPALAGGLPKGHRGGHGQVALVIGQKAQAGLRPDASGKAQMQMNFITQGDRLHHHLHPKGRAGGGGDGAGRADPELNRNIPGAGRL